jgi:hypothetical protein
MSSRSNRNAARRPQPAAVAFVLATGLLIGGAEAARADCGRPRITGFTTTGFACIERCGNVAVLFSGNTGCEHYNIRERGGLQFEHKRVRGHKPTAQLAPFPRNLPTNSTIHVSIQGCTRNLLGQSSCGAWSSEASFYIPDRSAKGRQCETYAQRAVGTLKLARDTYKCDPKTISGPRWSADVAEHRTWCLGADPKFANFEDRERFRIAQACRIAAGKAQGGKALIAVVSQGGDRFNINGSGFAPNAPVVIRLSGPGASIATVTVQNNRRITADARGRIAIRLFGAQICKRGGGDVTFVAQDQDNPPSPPVTRKCS